MARYRRRSKSPVRRALGWSFLLALLGWGGYRYTQLHNVLQQEGHRTDSLEHDLALVGSSSSSAESRTGERNNDLITLSAVRSSGVVITREAENEPAAAMVDPATSALFQQVDQSIKAGRPLDARTALTQALGKTTEGPAAEAIRERFAALHVPLFLGEQVAAGDPYAAVVAVRPGDSLIALAKQYKISVRLLEQLNPRVTAKTLRPGSGIKVVAGPFQGVLSASKGRLDLYLQDQFVRSMPAGLSEAAAVPTGKYRLKNAGVTGGRTVGGSVEPWTVHWLVFEGTDANGAVLPSLRVDDTDSPSVAGRTTVRLSRDDLRQLYCTLQAREAILSVQP